MHILQCPFNGCSSTTENESEAMAIALFNAHVSTHTAATPQPSQRTGASKSEKIIRPKVSQGMLEESWNSFLIQWRIYKLSAVLTDEESKLQLIYCCDQDLLEHILRSDPDITSKNEADQLKSIRKLCVVPVAMGVRRSEVLNLTQDSAELSRSFLSRIQGKAATCNFVTKCPANCCKTNPSSVDFSSVIIKYVLVNGLSDAEIRREALGWKDLDTGTLADTIAFIENKEMARDAYKGELSQVKTRYIKQQKDPKLRVKVKCELCDVQISQYVLLKSGKISERKFCAQCWKAKNVKKYNSASEAIPAATVADEASALVTRVGTIRDTTIATTRHKGRLAIILSHHIFDSVDGWKQRRADKQPMLKIEIQTCADMYDKLGVRAPPVNTSSIEGVADTGAQSCLWGMSQFYKCGFKKHQLIPVRQKMEAANRECIDIKGAIFLTIRASGFNSNAMVYVSPDVQGLYLSKQCLIELRCISRAFPCPGEADVIEAAIVNAHKQETAEDNPGGVSNSGDSGSQRSAECGCLSRRPPPGRPAALPMRCSVENIEKMKSWLVERYAASTFNKCTHQSLPFIQAEPMKLHVDKTAQPIAQHTPSIVPLHFREKVKEQLDADERLGVIEKVPEGVPTTWLHRLVITSKENGEPRRTVDLSPLNKYCARETHATTPPFHQARLIPAHTWKSVTDAWSGYHSALIAEEDRHLTSFITEWGRYQYRVAPQGYVSSNDGYAKRYDKIIEMNKLVHRKREVSKTSEKPRTSLGVHEKVLMFPKKITLM